MTGIVAGQTFRGEAVLPKVENDGFYRIHISPEISTHLNPSFANIRIVDQTNKEVPYLLQEEAPAYHTQVFMEYEV